MSGLLTGPYSHFSSTFTTNADRPLPRPAHRADQSPSLPLQIEEGQLSIHMVGTFKDVMSQTEVGTGQDFVVYRKKIVGPPHAAVGRVQDDFSSFARLELQIQRQDVFDDRRVPSPGVVQAQDAFDRR